MYERGIYTKKDTKKILKYNRLSEKANADGLLIVTPYYNKTTQFGLKENYKYIMF